MILPDDKKRIATIISRRKSASGENLGAAPMKPEIVKDEAGEVDGRHVASGDMLAAIKEGSAEKLMRALMNFQDIHANRIVEDSKEE